MPYPQELSQVRKLVEEHTRLEDEPLLIAIYFASPEAQEEECLFEVACGFGSDTVSEQRKIFRIQFPPTPEFDLPIRLSLTNPIEFEVALRERWPEIEELKQAIQSGAADVVYERGDSAAKSLLRSLGLAEEVSA